MSKVDRTRIRSCPKLLTIDARGADADSFGLVAGERGHVWLHRDKMAHSLQCCMGSTKLER